MKRVDVVTAGWNAYALIDSGDGRKLERFAHMVLDRPDPQALWERSEPKRWQLANAHFAWKEGGEKWKADKGMETAWELSYEELAFSLSLGKFKHIGIFPEHEAQWRELRALCRKEGGIRVLNLFGYTGAASIVAAAEGAKVTHIDASKQTIGIVKENMKRSRIADNAIRLVCEDALKYARRLVARGESFEAIIMDPPAFGRGPKGEVWKIEEKLAELLALVPQLLSKQARLVLLNGYAAGYSARSFGEMLSDVLKERKGEIVYGDVGILQQKNEKNADRVLSTGIYSRWTN